ncbi:site-specific DNA-methyltransferase [Algibacter pectinivorans]|nr:site-specific DNA-methyltransferase [Algibacter pectinivorans]
MSKEQKVTGNIQPPNKDLEILKQNFPSCFDKNGEFDFKKFKTQLSKNEINFSKENYGMDWLGKSYARLLATDETTTLLKEDETFNQKPENANSKNLLIKGDNLEVLKHLSNAYYEKVKMIYIDPPYNTGSDGFVYADDRKFTVDELQELAGISEERAKRILDFTQSKSNSHSAWLTFMYPRLYIAKQLLKDDGVIFVSIDDNEVAQLRLLMDEVFGEENFVAELIWKSRLSEDNRNLTGASIDHEYIVTYRKEFGTLIGVKKDLNKFSNPDNDPRGPWRSSDLTGLLTIDQRPNCHFDLINPETGITYKPPLKGWRNDFKAMKKKISENRILWPSTPSGRPRNKLFMNEMVSLNKNLSTIITQSSTNDGTKEVAKLIGTGIFTFPKPTKLLKLLVSQLNFNNDIILDFFAGSGTTGDAVMQLNAKDGGNRKFISVQLPELIDPKSNKTAYHFVKNELKVATPTIFEITKERLIRASKKIQEENKDKDLSNQDLGFKVFETMPIWEDYNFESEELEKQTSLFDESKLTREDVKALLVTWKTYDGVPLTTSIQEIDLNGYTAHYSSEKLYLMDKGFTTENLKILLEKIDSDKNFNPTTIIAFGYHFDSKNLREISENIKSYANKKSIDIDFITRY